MYEGVSKYWGELLTREDYGHSGRTFVIESIGSFFEALIEMVAPLIELFMLPCEVRSWTRVSGSIVELVCLSTGTASFPAPVLAVSISCISRSASSIARSPGVSPKKSVTYGLIPACSSLRTRSTLPFHTARCRTVHSRYGESTTPSRSSFQLGRDTISWNTLSSVLASTISYTFLDCLVHTASFFLFPAPFPIFQV